MKHKDVLELLGAVAILAAIIFASGRLSYSIVGSGCADLSPYAQQNGNVITFQTPSLPACNAVPSATCYSLPIDFSQKQLSGVSINVEGSKWYSRWDVSGYDVAETFQSSGLNNPAYFGNQTKIYSGIGGMGVHSDGITFTLAGTDGTRNWKTCCSGQCTGATYSASGTVTLAEIQQTEPQANPTGAATDPGSGQSSSDTGLEIAVIGLLAASVIGGLIIARRLH